MLDWESQIWQRLKVSQQELEEVRSRDAIMEEECRDYEQVMEAMRNAEAQSQAAGRDHTPDLELVRLARELEHDILTRLSRPAKQG